YNPDESDRATVQRGRYSVRGRADVESVARDAHDRGGDTAGGGCRDAVCVHRLERWEHSAVAVDHRGYYGGDLHGELQNAIPASHLSFTGRRRYGNSSDWNFLRCRC